jgi:ferredoxin
MDVFRYLEHNTLCLDDQACIGCGRCVTVCPHRVLDLMENRVVAVDPGACIECGACVTNCPVAAIQVTPGVGCAAYIITSWLNRVLGRSISTGCC